MKINIIAIFVLFSFPAFTQFLDDFRDGNYTVDPIWGGDVSQFEINTSKQLHLYSSGSDTSFLFTDNHLASIDNFQWEFWVKLSFNSSANNNSRVYLVTDQPNIEDKLNGYFVQIGGSNDSIGLFKQNGDVIQKMISGTVAFTGNSTNILRIKVTRDELANWRLFSDITGGDNFLLEGSAYDSTFESSSYFGIFCKYTSSNSTKIYFDDFKVEQIPIDTSPPKVIQVRVQNKNSINIEFDETVTQMSAEDVNNYFVSKGLDSPILATLLQGNKLVTLLFSNDFILNNSYDLIISNIEDNQENKVNSDTFKFSYFIPFIGDIVINEFFPDPTPSNGLPDKEFIELFNTSKHSAYLQNWTIADNTRSVIIPDVTIPSDSFLILCKPVDLPGYSNYGLAIGVSSQPGLNNAGDEVILKNQNDIIIDKLSYNTNWYNSDNKDDGGWTLERINPYYPCSDANNWTASNDNEGGTPGRRNSVFADTIDSTAPSILDIFTTNDTLLRVVFDENIDTSDIYLADFQVSCSNSIRRINFYVNSLNLIELTLDFPLIHLDSCTIKINNLKDCWGNKAGYWQSISFTYIVPEKVAVFDVIITEILPKPYPFIKLPESEFVELFNRSNKYLSLNNWTISDRTSSSSIPDFIIAPDSFVILCHEYASLFYQKFGTTIGLSSFPSLNDSEDEIYLRDSLDRIIFHINYEDSWFHDEVKKEGGWTLEMIDYNNICGQQENWAASKDKNGGTPGKINSIIGSNPDLTPPEIFRLYVSDQSHIKVYFTERMDSTTLINTINYDISPDIEHPTTIGLESPYYDNVLLTLPINLHDNITYKLEINNIADCAGNKIKESTVMEFTLPNPVDSTDIIINELLFNPQPGGFDFVELFNRSEKVIELKSLKIATYDDNLNIKQPMNISLYGYQLFPKDYVVLTENSEDINNRYIVKHPKKIIEVSSLPSFNDKEGDVLIIKNTGEIIDYFHYSEDYHFSLLDNDEGVSLERITPNQPSNLHSNWLSAASSYGYATPTYKNSQFNEIITSDNEIIISPKVFSPDQDGYDDVLKIQYNFAKTGNFGSISIYDVSGRKIRSLINNETFGKEGFYIWDGTDEKNEKVTIGVYIIFIEVANLNGTIKRYKKTCTLARKM